MAASLTGLGTRVDEVVRDLLITDEGLTLRHKSGILDATYCYNADNSSHPYVIYAGTVIGGIKSSGVSTGYFRPSILAINDQAYVDDDTLIDTTAAHAKNVNYGNGTSGTIIFVNSADGLIGTAITQVTAIAYSACVITGGTEGITIANNVYNAAGAIGGLILASGAAAVDGSEYWDGLLPCSVDVWDEVSGAVADRPLPPLITGGYIRTSRIPMYSSMNATAKRYLKSKLRGYPYGGGAAAAVTVPEGGTGGTWRFDDED